MTLGRTLPHRAPAHAKGRPLRPLPGVGVSNVRQTIAGVVIVIAAVVAGNLLYLAGWFDPNPLVPLGQLGTITHAGVLPGVSSTDGAVGYTSQALGHLAAADLLHGHLPWWNPYEGVGAPLAGEMQSAALFPLTLLLWFGDGQLYFHMVLEAVAGLATFQLLRRLSVGWAAASVFGCLFALSGTFAWLGNAPVNPVAFLPLLLLGVERARDRTISGRGFGYGLVAIALALSLYAGFPEMALFDGLFALAWAAVRAAGMGRPELIRYGGKLAVGAGVGLLLAAPIAVAFADYLPAAYLGPHSVASFYASFSLPHTTAAAVFLPYLFGPLFGFSSADHSGALLEFWVRTGGFLTTSLLVLDLTALWGRRHRPLRLVAFAWMVVALGRIIGIQPFWRLVDAIPYMDHVEVSRYLWPSVELAAVVLAAVAVDDLRRGEVPRFVAGAAVAVSAGVVAASVAGGSTLLHAIAAAPHATAWAVGSVAWGTGVLLVVAVAVWCGRARWARAMLLACVAVEALGMFALPELSAPRHVSYDGALVTWIQRHEPLGRIASLGPFEPDYGSYVGIMEADVNDIPVPSAYARYIHRHLDPNTNPVIFTGLSSPPPTPLDELRRHLAGFEAIGVTDAIAAPGAVPQAAATAMGLRLVHADRGGVVWRLPHPAPYYRASKDCTVGRPSIDAVSVHCSRPGTIWRQALDLAGSIATARGRTLRVRPARPVAERVGLPTGSYMVRFSYVPPHEVEAFAAALVGLALLVLPLATEAGRRRGLCKRPDRQAVAEVE